MRLRQALHHPGLILLFLGGTTVGAMAGARLKTALTSVHLRATLDASGPIAAVTVEVVAPSRPLRLRFAASETRLGIRNLEFRSRDGEPLEIKAIPEVLLESGVLAHWYELSDPDGVRLTYQVAPPARLGSEEWYEREGCVGPVTVLKGMHLMPVPDGPFGSATVDLPAGAVSGLPRRVEDVAGFQELLVSPFACGTVPAASDDLWILHLDRRYTAGEAAAFVRGFQDLCEFVAARTPQWRKQPLHVVLARRQPDTVPVLGMASAEFVFLDTDRPYPELWGDVIHDLVNQRFEEEWFALALGEWLASDLLGQLEPGSRALDVALSYYEQAKGKWDVDLNDPLPEGTTVRRRTKLAWTHKGAAILSLLDAALESAGRTEGLRGIAWFWGNGSHWASLLGTLYGPEVLGRIRDWTHAGSLPYTTGKARSLAIGPAPPRDAGGASLVLAFTGSGLGLIETCGCAPRAAGGISRMARVLDGLRKEDRNPLFVHLGNALSFSGARVLGPLEDREHDVYLELLDLIGTDVLVPGTTELLRGAGYYLDRVESRAFGTTLCTAGDRFPGAPHHIVERNGLRLAIVGVSEPYSAADQLPELSRRFGDIPDPVPLRYDPDRLEATIDEVHPTVDLVVVAGWMTPDTTYDLIRRMGDRIDVVLSDNPSIREVWPLELRQSGAVVVDRTLLMVHAFGKHGVTSAALCVQGPHQVTGIDYGIAILDASVEESETVGERLRRFYAETAEMERQNVGDWEPLITNDEAFAREFVGSEACVACHLMETQQYATTPHAKAFGTLIRIGRQHSFKCASCHVTGFGLPTGWAPDRPEEHLRNVGCESCHGGGAEHVLLPSASNIRRTPRQSTCVACHDTEHSPTFAAEFGVRWLDVVHRKD